jgi:hypothetical protein
VKARRALPQSYGNFTRFTLTHTFTAGAIAALAVGLWALALTLPATTALLSGVVAFVVHYFCWRPAGPLRRRVERSYDSDGNLRQQ